MDTILVANAGSSSVKFQIFGIEDRGSLQRQVKGQIDGVGTRPRMRIVSAAGDVLADRTYEAATVSDVAAALATAGAWLRDELKIHPIAIGHRVVHGGPDYDKPVRVNQDVLARLERYISLAPLHQPYNLAPIRSILGRFPDIPQVACFDTAFHRSHGALADHYAIPQHLYAEGVRRYGFHGLSYEYIANALPQVAPEIASKRVIVAHLGSGASMCALEGGRSVESSMGFTALDGIPMGTRPGQIDPGVLLYLMSEKGMSPADVQDLLYRECGLKGLSGISNDMRQLEASDDPRAIFAIEYFVYRVCLYAGMMAAALQGLDGLVFTAGVGENSARVRGAVAKNLAWLGVSIDKEANAKNAQLISAPESDVAVYVLPTDEELMIAQHTWSLLSRSPEFSATREGVMTIPVYKETKVALKDRKGLIVGIANDQSIAWGCAKAFRALGADLAVTYLNDKAMKYVEPLARELEAPIFMPLDVQVPGQMEKVFERIEEEWGQLDFLVHSIAFSPKEALHGRVIDVKRDGFLATMDVSCWSFMRMAHLAEPLMKNGGTLFTMTYYGSQMVVENYNIMGVAKAALECAVRYIAAEVGPKGIRVHAISPGPLATRAASGIPEFDELLAKAQSKAPARSLVSIDDVGRAVAFLALDGAKLMTGDTLYIDGGYHIID